MTTSDRGIVHHKPKFLINLSFNKKKSIASFFTSPTITHGNWIVIRRLWQLYWWWRSHLVKPVIIGRALCSSNILCPWLFVLKPSLTISYYSIYAFLHSNRDIPERKAIECQPTICPYIENIILFPFECIVFFCFCCKVLYIKSFRSF